MHVRVFSFMCGFWPFFKSFYKSFHSTLDHTEVWLHTQVNVPGRKVCLWGGGVHDE